MSSCALISSIATSCKQNLQKWDCKPAKSDEQHRKKDKLRTLFRLDTTHLDTTHLDTTHLDTTPPGHNPTWTQPIWTQPTWTQPHLDTTHLDKTPPGHNTPGHNPPGHNPTWTQPHQDETSPQVGQNPIRQLNFYEINLYESTSDLSAVLDDSESKGIWWMIKNLGNQTQRRI